MALFIELTEAPSNAKRLVAISHIRDIRLASGSGALVELDDKSALRVLEKYELIKVVLGSEVLLMEEPTPLPQEPPP